MNEGKGVEQIIDEKTPEIPPFNVRLVTSMDVSEWGRLIFQYVVGIAGLLVVSTLFESLPWIYDPMMIYIIKAADYLPILVIMWVVLLAGHLMHEAMQHTLTWVSKLNKIVNKEETEK